MLIRPQSSLSDPPRNTRRERKLWHDEERNMPSLGCWACPERHLCGGLQTRAGLFDCLSLCCGQPERCDTVCRNHPDYVDRVREVGTFALDTVPRSPLIPAPSLPPVIPVIFHGHRRVVPVQTEAAALSLYQMFNRRDGSLRFATHEALCTAFNIVPGTPIVLTGTDQDASLERWWSLGERRRREIIRSLRTAGVILATTPNYSLFIDLPRWDDLHAIKRIGLVHHEFLSEGLPAALHINGRTNTDFRRWTEFVQARPEITHLAYEFTTGTGWAGRREQHAAWLVELATQVGRPIDLVVRGGTEVLPVLASAFSQVTVLDTTAFMMTMMRQRAIPTGNFRMTSEPAPTAEGEPLDRLLAENLETRGAWLRALAAPPAKVLP